MKTLVYSARPYDTPFLEKAAEGKHDLIFTPKKLSLDTVSLASGCEAIALFTSDDASAKVLQKLQNFGIRFVALRSAGYDHVDLAKAKNLGLRIANVPAYSPYSVAEHAITILLALNRRIVESQLLMQLHDYRLDTLTGFDLHGKTVGIIGTGTIGVAFASIVKGFGMNIIATDPVQNPAALALGVKYVDLNTLLKNSDVISLHCPLNEHTKHMISAPQLSVMKKGAVLVNTSRGGIVNTEHLLDAVESGHLGGACIDVYEKEKPIFFEDHRNSLIADPLFARLRNNRNVIVTGHQAFLTREALTGIAATTIENLDFWEDGENAPHELFTLETTNAIAR